MLSEPFSGLFHLIVSFPVCVTRGELCVIPVMDLLKNEVRVCVLVR